MHEPEALAPSPKSKKKLSGSLSGSVLLQRSKVTVNGPVPDGGSGLVVRTANGAWFVVVGSVVVVVLVGARVVVVVVELTPTATVVVVVSLLLLLTTTAAVPAAAAPAPTMPTPAAVPMPPPTKPAGTADTTPTAAWCKKGP